MTIPTDPITPPAIVTAHAAGRPILPVWRNELGGLTFQLGTGDQREFLKWAPHDVALDLTAEATRLRWAEQYTAVPRVLDEGTDESGSWLLTAGVPGRSAVDPRWLAEPDTAVRAIGTGLRALHDTLPVADCPFDWSVPARLKAMQADDEVLARLADPPPVDRLVVCHGDACAPNTLVAPDGTCSGHVDLGALGTADPWADLAIATWSTQWNYGPGWENLLLDAYGIDPNAEKTQYYRLIWELSD